MPYRWGEKDSLRQMTKKYNSVAVIADNVDIACKHNTKRVTELSETVENMNKHVETLVESSLVPDFDNYSNWVGCDRETFENSDGSFQERIVSKEEGIVLAERMTKSSSDNDFTETYTYYNKDETVKMKFSVRTVKDVFGKYTETITNLMT